VTVPNYDTYHSLTPRTTPTKAALVTMNGQEGVVN
jgi:hypothetical protein